MDSGPESVTINHDTNKCMHFRFELKLRMSVGYLVHENNREKCLLL